MKNLELANAFEAFEITDLEKVIGGAQNGVHWTPSGGGDDGHGHTYVDWQSNTGLHMCGLPDGSFPGDPR